MDDEQETNNIFRIVPGGATEDPSDDNLPVNSYVITTATGREYFGEGFLVFTSQHVAVMKETPKGAIPALVIPLTNVESAELIEDEELDEDN